MYTIYGIKNCNTVKKALTLLDEIGIKYQFHDYKKMGITKAVLKDFEAQIGWETLVNKKGTTWRTLDEAEKVKIVNAESAITLMLEKNSVIKRPIICDGTAIKVVGFDEAAIRSLK
jgi:arsenate reductase